MSKTLDHATREIELLLQQSTDPENRPIIEPFVREILALVGAFGRLGQSGGSAPVVAAVIAHTVEQLCLQKTISPILDIEDDWMLVTGATDLPQMYQHKRCSALFRESKDSKPYYLDAIVWMEEGKDFGSDGRAKVIRNGTNVTVPSYQQVKFPFEPKTFYITCKTDIDGVRWVKEAADLVPVFKHYDFINVEK